MVTVVNDEKLSKVLSEFARTLITEFPIQGILDHLVERIVEVMPVTSAGVTDLRTDLRYPRFAPAAVSAGLAAVFTFPLRDGGGRLGALDLYRDTTGELDDHDIEAAQTLADVAPRTSSMRSPAKQRASRPTSTTTARCTIR